MVPTKLLGCRPARVQRAQRRERRHCSAAGREPSCTGAAGMHLPVFCTLPQPVTQNPSDSALSCFDLRQLGVLAVVRAADTCQEGMGASNGSLLQQPDTRCQAKQSACHWSADLDDS